MSEAKRYAMTWATDENEFVYVSPVESASGKWVNYEDYARLRASSFVTAVPVEQYERVVDAGDSIITITCQHVHPTMANLALREWNAAKEGKPSV